MAYPQQTFSDTVFEGETLLSRRRDAVARNTLLYQLEVLKNTGRYDAFRLKWHPSYNDKPNVWPIPNHLFWDSDIAKWLESACYFLHSQPNETIQAAVEELVEMIRKAQQPDGYINIHYTVVAPGQRFTNLRDFHELYNAGHLIEAALAHEQLFHNSDLLAPIVKYADLLVKTFGPREDQIHGYPGHPEIELALIRLSERTKNTDFQNLAMYFIEERGNPSGVEGQHFYTREAEKRGDDPNMRPDFHIERGSLWYYQAHRPIVEQETIEGHAVRAMYLLTAAADIVRVQPDKTHSLRGAVLRLWSNMVERKMYITGGIGAVKQYEGFGRDYFLPQSDEEGGCYAETCAAIGVVMLAQRLLQLDLDGRYADVMELCLYNAVLTGMSCDGKQFTYDNPLASCNSNTCRREKWFTCACCPPNVSRLLGSISGYIWDWKYDATDDKIAVVNVHMFTSATLHFGEKCTLQQRSLWPWDGNVRFYLEAPSSPVALRIRIPAWCREWTLASLAKSSHPETSRTERGYLYLSPQWLMANPEFEVSIKLESRFIVPHPYTNQHVVAVARGPVVYCAEEIDNAWADDHFRSTCIDLSGCKISEEEVEDKDMRESYLRLTANGAFSDPKIESISGPFLNCDDLTRVLSPEPRRLVLVPYYYRANRQGHGQMRVCFRVG